MGLERISAVLQGVHSNYEIDLFQPLLKVAAHLAGTQDLNNSSLRVVADHIRSCAFLIADGVLPSNEGRGYVLRRIIRRAIRHGYRLGIHETFFYQLVAPLVAEMGAAYPELAKAQEQVERVLKKEEERFAETLEQGMKILEGCVSKLDSHVIPGDVVFLLYDTYGFPVDLTADFAREHNLSVDHAGFEVEMTAQRERARAGGSFAADYDQDIKHNSSTEFTGYFHLEGSVQIIGLFKQGQAVESLDAGEEGVVILDQTPFYAESGGQVGDTGRIVCTDAVFAVEDTHKQGGKLFLHKGKVLQGTLSTGQACEVSVNADIRKATERNHSATHLLHAALRQTLGEHVAQKGSQVNSERLRFDFSHFEPMTAAEIASVEHLVNEQIRLNKPVAAEIMDKEQAVKAGAMALFGEKYGDEVRVLRIGEFSTELCGGTHVDRAGDIGVFKIISETGVAAGVRRIEAVTGQGALDWLDEREMVLQTIAGLLKSAPDKAADKVQQLLEKHRSLEKELEKLKSKLASSAGDELTNQAVDVNGVKVLAVKLDDIDPKALRDLADQLKNKLGNAALVLATVSGDKVSLIASVSKESMDKVKAGDLVNFVATQVGGKGGGRPDMAQAGGNDPSGLVTALKQVPAWVKAKLD
jgi:alanyl-tRNA synthetase